MVFAIPCRHSIPRRFEDSPPDGGDYHTKQDNGGGVVLGDIVYVTGTSREAWHREVGGDALHQQREGTRHQDNKTRENENMNSSRGPVTRMLPDRKSTRLNSSH